MGAGVVGVVRVNVAIVVVVVVAVGVGGRVGVALGVVGGCTRVEIASTASRSTGKARGPRRVAVGRW